MRKMQGKEAAYLPQQGQTVVMYTHKFKPQHFRAGVEFVTNQFPDVQMQIKQKRHNIFLERPSTHELVNITFFEDGASVDEWNQAEARLSALDKLQPMLDGPIDMQVFEVAGVVGIGD